MDRETVITHLQIIHTWAEFAHERDLQFFTAKHLKDIAQWADDALNLLKEQKWIPVTERLPKSMINRVLVYVQHEDLTGYIGFGHFEKFKGEEMWYDLENNCQFSTRGYTVTHWMETPIPPMEGL